MSIKNLNSAEAYTSMADSAVLDGGVPEFPESISLKQKLTEATGIIVTSLLVSTLAAAAITHFAKAQDVSMYMDGRRDGRRNMLQLKANDPLIGGGAGDDPKKKNLKYDGWQAGYNGPQKNIYNGGSKYTSYVIGGEADTINTIIGNGVMADNLGLPRFNYLAVKEGSGLNAYVQSEVTAAAANVGVIPETDKIIVLEVGFNSRIESGTNHRGAHPEMDVNGQMALFEANGQWYIAMGENGNGGVVLNPTDHGFWKVNAVKFGTTSVNDKGESVTPMFLQGTVDSNSPDQKPIMSMVKKVDGSVTLDLQVPSKGKVVPLEVATAVLTSSYNNILIGANDIGSTGEVGGGDVSAQIETINLTQEQQAFVTQMNELNIKVACDDRGRCKNEAGEIIFDNRANFPILQAELEKSGRLSGSNISPLGKGDAQEGSFRPPSSANTTLGVELFNKFIEFSKITNGKSPFETVNTGFVMVMLDPETNSWGIIADETINNQITNQFLVFEVIDTDGNSIVRGIPVNFISSSEIRNFWLNKNKSN